MKNIRKKLDTSSEDEAGDSPIITTRPRKKAGLNANELTKRETKILPQKKQFSGGLVQPEDYRTKLEDEGIIKANVKEKPKTHEVHMKSFIETEMAKIQGVAQVSKQEKTKFIESKVEQIKIPASAIIKHQPECHFAQDFIYEIDLGDENRAFCDAETDKTLMRTMERTILEDLDDLETFPRTLQLYSGERAKVEKTNVRVIEGQLHFKLADGLPTEKIVFSKFVKRERD